LTKSLTSARRLERDEFDRSFKKKQPDNWANILKTREKRRESTRTPPNHAGIGLKTTHMWAPRIGPTKMAQVRLDTDIAPLGSRISRFVTMEQLHGDARLVRRTLGAVTGNLAPVSPI